MKKTVLILIAGFIFAIAAMSCKKNCICTVVENGREVAQRQMGPMKSDECKTTKLEKEFNLPENHTLLCAPEE